MTGAAGVTVAGAGVTQNLIAGNYVGLNAAGTAALFNVQDGISVFGLDGGLQALIEANLMGAYRTGAATGVAAKALAPSGTLTVCLLENV